MSKISKLTALSLCILALWACASPLSRENGRTDIKLKFLLSGLPATSEARSAAGRTVNADSRLLLPTALSLNVTLSPSAEGLTPATTIQVPIVSGPPAGATAAFAAVILGQYAIKAEAVDADGAVVFKQSATLNLTGSGSSLVFNLIPAAKTGTTFPQLLAPQNLVGVLAAKSSATWTIPASSLSLGVFSYKLNASADVQAFVQDPDGLLLGASDVGTVAKTSGDYYFTLYNSGAASASYTVTYNQDVGAVSISLKGTSLSFSPSAVSVQKGLKVSLATGNTRLLALAGWKWRIDEVLSSQVASSFSFDSALYTLGAHTISAQVVDSGVLYTGNLTVFVVPSGTTYTVAYSSQGAEFGSSPVDAARYLAGANVTVSGNTRALRKSGWKFLGWTTTADGSGNIYIADSTYSITADTVFYPCWGSSIIDAMKFVPGGSFQRDADPKNISTVSAFYMSETEVTQGQYYRLMTVYPPSAYTAGDRDSHPWEKLNHYEALVFCNKLSILEGLVPVYTINGTTDPALWPGMPTIPTTVTASWDAALCDMSASGYRLPTEAEWEWAAMGATKGSGYTSGVYTTGYLKEFAGDPNPTLIGDALANYAWTSANASITQVIGTKSPNELGLFDMSGNVYEKCWDRFMDGDSYPVGLFINPVGGVSSKPATMSRGGAFSYNYTQATVANRPTQTYVNAAWSDVGLRLVRRAPGNDYVTRNGLEGEWLFNGNGANSSVVSTNTATPLGAGTVPALGRQGVADSAYSFAGATADTRIKLTACPLLGGTATPTVFTLSLWINTTKTGGYGQTLFMNVEAGPMNWDGANTNATLHLDGSNRVNFGMWPYSAGLPNLISDAAVPLNQWTHIAVVRNGANRSIYINGALSIADAGGQTYSGVAVAEAYFGQNSNFDNNWDFVGRMDDVRIYTRALSPAEITALYQE